MIRYLLDTDVIPEVRKPKRHGGVLAWINGVPRIRYISRQSQAARLMAGKSDHLLDDAMIAATARVHALKLATRNEGDFELLHVDVVNPFKTPLKA
jgi:hypothetical protein